MLSLPEVCSQAHERAVLGFSFGGRGSLKKDVVITPIERRIATVPCFYQLFYPQSCADLGGLKNHKNIDFHGNTDPKIPWKTIKLLRQSSKAIIGLPAKRHSNGVSLAGRLWPTFCDIWILSPLTKTSWTPSGKTFWIRARTVLEIWQH